MFLWSLHIEKELEKTHLTKTKVYMDIVYFLTEYSITAKTLKQVTSSSINSSLGSCIIHKFNVFSLIMFYHHYIIIHINLYMFIINKLGKLLYFKK